MKRTLLMAAAAVMASTASFAAEAIRSNVPCDGGSVPGFLVQSGTVDFYAINGTDVGACPAGTVELPADVHPFDLDEVQTYLATIEPGVDYRLKGGNEVLNALGEVIRVRRPINEGW